ncbi:hypothetical protein H0H92_006212 [Tricholoma furcatifolium]|nr:hypothetical protein H0H92_006212 [Tricholoma furcatifolium]
MSEQDGEIWARTEHGNEMITYSTDDHASLYSTMSRIPPNLLYLSIYNPTLKPDGPVSDDDEDAEEQSHILFYTAKERAVSRDRMLRQVGLAKALINFSDIFNGADMCNNVHSQSKRLIMVSPEPNFWIHAGLEVAKVPRSPPDKGKTKAKNKSKPSEKGKGKEIDSDNAPLYDYQEGSIHDIALRADILRGYEEFKLTHGSFISILSSIGKEGLELQLERFFTVWAWSWNLEEGPKFGEHLVQPILDDFSEQFPNIGSSIFIQPPYVIPSRQYSASKFPASLSRHLLSLVPPIPLPPQGSSQDATSKSIQLKDGDQPHGKDPPTGSSSSSFLGIPPVNKWGWPTSLTFGKGSSKRPALEETKSDAQDQEPALNEEKAVEEAVTQPGTPTNLDPDALEDAISDVKPDNVVPASEIDRSLPELVSDTQATEFQTPDSDEKANDLELIQPSSDPINSTSIESSETAAFDAEPKDPPKPALTFSSINVHLPGPNDPHLTTRRKVFYIRNDQSVIALVGLDEAMVNALPDLPQSAVTLLDDIETLFSAEMSKTLTPDQIPSVSNILQPTDSHIVSNGQFAISSPNFSSRSNYLFDAQELQTRDPDISEVFSRGLNPQHWHIARCSPSAEEHGASKPGEVYMQVFRKEATLSDVDNVLAGVVRRNGLLDGAV